MENVIAEATRARAAAEPRSETRHSATREGATRGSTTRESATRESAPAGALRFALCFVGFCALAAFAVGRQPLQLSVATVFVFAGPHNWMEFRYFLARTPARWGRARAFYATGLLGVAALTAGYLLLYAAGQSWYLDDAAWTLGVSAWNTLLIFWVCWLVRLHGRTFRRGERPLVFAAGCALSAAAWAQPALFSLGLVYLHPLVALWFLDRQLKRTRPGWRRGYHASLAALAVIFCLMLAALARTPDLDAGGDVAWRVTQHAGAGIVAGVSTHVLVAAHVFLETVHYGVWLVVIPLVGLGAPPWRTRGIGLASPRGGWPRVVRAALVLAAFAVVALWVCFAADYATTRDLYFAFAVAHVLAEAPFLIRLL